MEFNLSHMRFLAALRMAQSEGFTIMRIEIKHGEASALPQTNMLQQLKMILQQIECTQPENQTHKHITTENSKKLLAHHLTPFRLPISKASL